MEVELSLNKSVEENASFYFEESKKAKKKIEGIKKAISVSKEHLENIESTEKSASADRRDSEKKETDGEGNNEGFLAESKPEQKKEWYEKFRWFFTSSGFLVVAGRDATTNEIIIKKHTSKEDIVFHADMPGSPFAVIKTEGKKPTGLDLEEVAQFTASYSRAWKLGISSAEVFYVSPEQVSSKVKAGEFMGKGSFMIYGKRTSIRPILKVAIGNVNGRIEGSILSAIKKRTDKYVEVTQGSEKASFLAKKIQKLIGGSLDDIIRVLPAGGCRMVKGFEKSR